jgi:hypothetical protein
MIDPATLRLRYPAFAAVSDATIQYWLTDAERIVTAEWGDDEEPASFALAAHHMATNRVAGLVQDASAMIPAGVTSFRSAAFSADVSVAAANRTILGGYSSTSYGIEFAAMQRRNFGGPRLVGLVHAC